MSRRNLARLVLVVWILALAWLARRELFRGETSMMTAGTATLAPETRYFRVDVGALQLGVLNLTWDTLPTGFEVQQLLALDLPAGETIRRHLRVTEAITSRALTLRSATQSYSSPSGTEEVTYEVRSDTLQSYFVRTSGPMARTTSRTIIGERPTLTEILPVRLAFGKRLTVGEMMDEPVADLERQATIRLRGRVAGDRLFVLPDSVEFDTVAVRWRTVTLDTIETWQLDMVRDGLPERWWVDEAGRLVRLETAFGVSFQLGPFDYSHMLYRDTLRATGPAPRRGLAGIRSLVGSGVALDTLTRIARYALSRVDGPLAPETIAVLGGGRQTVENGVLIVRRGWPADSIAPPTGYLADAGVVRGPGGRMRLMADTAFQGAASARDSVITLTGFLARRMILDTNPTSPREVGFVRTGQAGTPDALSRLLVSLARLGGIPARVVNGLAVTDDGLLAHTWAEVWVGGGWVAVDPSTGHAPASARLLRITEGGLGRPFETLLRTAALRVDPLAMDPR